MKLIAAGGALKVNVFVCDRFSAEIPLTCEHVFPSDELVIEAGDGREQWVFGIPIFRPAVGPQIRILVSLHLQECEVVIVLAIRVVRESRYGSRQLARRRGAPWPGILGASARPVAVHAPVRTCERHG